MELCKSLVIPGFKKCGTTSLFHVLNQHPEISAGTPVAGSSSNFVKELHFFDSPMKETIESYYGRFEDRGEKFQLDATPRYLSHEGAFERLVGCMPKVKLIVIMRDPVERAYSEWNHWDRLSPERQRLWSIEDHNGVFLDVLKREEKSFRRGRARSSMIGNGFYAFHLKRALQMISRDQLHVLFLEDFAKDFRSEMDRLSEFLQLETNFLESRRLNFHNKQVQPLDDETKNFLKRVYTDDSRDLEALLNRPLPYDWHKSDPK